MAFNTPAVRGAMALLPCHPAGRMFGCAMMQDAVVSAIVSAVAQVAVVLAIAGAVYLMFGRKTGSFSRYVGLHLSTWRAVSIAAALALIFGSAAFFVPGLREIATGEGSVVGKIAKGSFNETVVTILAIKAVFQTSLSEELLFRGLIAKRLIANLGFIVGNTVQAALFAAVHLLLLLIPGADRSLIWAFVIFVGVFAWLWGWINEKIGGGSILPSWIGHGLGNLISYLGFAYLAAQ